MCGVHQIPVFWLTRRNALFNPFTDNGSPVCERNSSVVSIPNFALCLASKRERSNVKY
jgi:hypothetical protein